NKTNFYLEIEDNGSGLSNSFDLENSEGFGLNLVNATRQLVQSGAYAPLGIDPVVESIDDFRKYSQRYVSDGAVLLKSSGYKPE
ncbi:hypothetical protein P3G55_24560, partial [Leptospira sp. 96542]|nr:hypothetical protein [Leptospira sp. 96542]